MSKILLVMRHAKSSWSDSGLSDFDRPLNKRGLRDAPRMAAFLEQQQSVPEVIISSTANRAASTAQLVADHCSYAGNVRFNDSFYHGAPADYLRGLKQLPIAIQRCMVVGHNPGLENLVEQLTDVWERMPTAAIAVVSLPIADWDRADEMLECDLLEVWRPKELF